MINTDASGQGSLQYGKTSDHVLSLRSVLINGDILDTESIDYDQFEDNIAAANLLLPASKFTNKPYNRVANIVHKFLRICRSLTVLLPVMI